MSYLVEFERCKQGTKNALAVRILDPAADETEARVIAEALFTGDPGVALTGDQDIAVLKLPLTDPQRSKKCNPT